MTVTTWVLLVLFSTGGHEVVQGLASERDCNDLGHSFRMLAAQHTVSVAFYCEAMKELADE